MEMYLDQRNWGSFSIIYKHPTHIEKEKIIVVKPNSALSLQRHRFRSEEWYVLEGSGKVIVGEKEISVNVGDRIYVSAKEKHRIMTNGSNLILLECGYGWVNEKDIERFEDRYGRVGTQV